MEIVEALWEIGSSCGKTDLCKSPPCGTNITVLKNRTSLFTRAPITIVIDSYSIKGLWEARMILVGSLQPNIQVMGGSVDRDTGVHIRTSLLGL